ncbi:MAG: LUD domain-containing protein [Candidatus Aminicenantes bacterium]|nr:LUD domain-containing protein [Candidatus Aminicenantes bacterium]
MKKIDPGLKKILQDFSKSYRAKRQTVLEGYDFEALRTALAELKDRSLDQNAELLDRFADQARAHGGIVLRARDGGEANDMVLKICRDHGVRKMVKSKSMVSEETGLNGFLSGHGIEARETDLGEWIVQLAAERPTHMVLPAIHLTRRDVAALFAAKFGRPVPEDIPALVRLARGEIRKEIFAAQAGLSGANALIAENGAIMLLTNEGNGRLVTSVPPVHIVLASLEKVVPTVADALTLLRLLPRNATGQTITSYVSFIAGPHRGPQYIILLDNHRSEMLADPRFREVLRCVKCSACLNVCPVYQLIGGEEYSHIYMGGIGTLFTAWIHGLKASKDLVKVCLRCHRCEEYCAAKIPIADLITALAGRIRDKAGAPIWKRFAFDGVLSNPRLQRIAFRAARTARKVIAKKDGFSRKLPAWMKKYDRFRALPAPAAATFSKLFKAEFGAERAAAKTSKGPVTIFGGCLVEHFYPEIGLAAARVLTKLGYEVKAAPGLCCGFPPSNAGFEKAAGRAFAALVKKIEIDGPLITVCPTCTTMLAKRGAEIVASEKAKALAAKVVPFSRFVVENEKESLDRLLNTERPELRATYHDSCHHKNLLRAERASRTLVEAAARSGIREMDEPDACCGFAGTFSVDNPEISAELLADKLAAIERTGADLVAMDCPGCLLQIRGGVRRKGLALRSVHTAELLEKAIN